MTEGELFKSATQLERNDVLAYLRQRLANAETVAFRTPESDADYALYRDRVRQLSIQIEDVMGARHVGEADVAEFIGFNEAGRGA